jgi:alkylation response protein AidB-like acyl-CoA dehydrogenase
MASAGAINAAWGWTTVLLLRIYTGVAKAGRDWLAGYLNERVPSNLGASLATLPRFQAAMGEIETLVFTADTLLDDLAAKLDGGGPVATEASKRAGLVKVVVTGNVIKALESGLALIGNPGLSYHHPLQRHYRNALCSRIHTPQDDVILTAAGQAVLTR